jgi:predicted RNA polymerase sigma factor
MADGPAAGLALLDALHAARAHLLEMSGDRDRARAAYVLAARLATNQRHVRYLHTRAERLEGNS